MSPASRSSLGPAAGTSPVIGITADLAADVYRLGRGYVDLIAAAGAAPVILPCALDLVPTFVERCDGFVLSGGDDPDTGQWGIPLHPKAKPMHPERQAFEWAILEAVAARDDKPVLGVCLGMQLMAIHAGGALDQHLADRLGSAADHLGREHGVSGPLGTGVVQSHHRQAIVDPGGLTIVGRAHDGVIEAVRDEGRAFYLGVQWHPERTTDPALGRRLFEELVAAASSST